MSSGAVRPLGAAAGAVVGCAVRLGVAPLLSAALDRPAPDRAGSYRQALEAFYAGDDELTAVRFETLADEGPGLQLAREYLAETGRRQPDQNPAPPTREW